MSFPLRMRNRLTEIRSSGHSWVGEARLRPAHHGSSLADSSNAWPSPAIVIQAAGSADEPLDTLDKQLRQQLQLEVKQSARSQVTVIT